MIYCIEFSELTRHALRGCSGTSGGKEGGGKTRGNAGLGLGSLVCRANDLQHYAARAGGQHDASRAEQQISMSLVLIKQIEVYEGLSLCINKLLVLI